MTEYDGDARPLPWPIRDPLVFSRETETDPENDGSVFVWPDDPDERTNIIFNLSLNEFVVLASAVDAGSDIAYGVDALRVWWLWDRVLRVPTNICNAIIACITSNPATQQAIVDMLMSNEDFNDYLEGEISRLTTGQITGKIIGGDCNDGVVAGRSMQLVNRLDENNVDFLEVLEVGTNDEEKTAALLEAIPVLGEAPVGDTIDFLQDILEDFAENYNAASTTDRREKTARDIWCIMKESPDCSITYEQLYEYFQQKAGSGLTIGAIVKQIFDFVTTGDFQTDDLVFYGLMAIQTAFILVGRDFGGLNLPRIGGLMRDALPSTIWEEWEPCGPAGERTPVINSLWDPTRTAGTLEGPDENGFWTVTSGSRGSDEASTLMDVNGRDFILTDVTYSQTPNCFALLLDGELIYLGCGGGNMYTGQVIDEFTATWSNGAHRTMQFKMVAPDE